MRIYYGLPQLKCTIEMWVGLDRGGLIASLSIRPLLEFFKVKFGGDVVKYSQEIGEILVNIRISLINCQNSDKKLETSVHRDILVGYYVERV